MRICILTVATLTHRMGGSELHAETLASEAAALGHEVTLVTSSHPDGLPGEEKNGYKIVYLPGTHFSMSRAWARRWWPASTEALKRLRAEGKADVVWAENFSGLAYAALPRSERAPVVSIVNGLAVRGEIISNLNRISTAGELLYFLTRYAAQMVFYYIPRFRAMTRDSDLLVGVSRESSAAVTKEFPASIGRVRTILNPVNTSLFTPDPELRREGRRLLGIRDEETAVLMSGVVHKQKGMHLGLGVVAGLGEKVRLVIVGDGPHRAQLEAKARELGLSERVIFCGMKQNREMPVYYNAADVYLNPTLRIEGLPLVVLEAMACGLPSVLSRIGGIPSAIDDGVNGFLVKPGDTAALSEKLCLLAGDQALRRSMGDNARKKALEVFDRKVVVRQYLAASEDLLKASA